MKLELTPAAKMKLQEMQEEGLYYKLDVGREGCCAYFFTLVPGRPKESDVICQVDGFTIPVSAKVNMAATSLKIDYKRRGLSKTFHIIAN